MDLNCYHHFPPSESKAHITILNALTAVARTMEIIMSEITDLKNAVAELKKDSARALDALTATRQSLADMAAALDALKSQTNLSAEDRAAVDDIKTMVTDADAAIETAVPEVPAPADAPSDTPV